jgi:hypothetical protein
MLSSAQKATMRVLASTAVCFLLAGCGAGKPAAHLSDREKVANVCGDLRARIEGIGNEAGARDPQPATLRGNLTATRLRPAVKEALSSLAESRRELERLHASQAAIDAISGAVSGYDIFARRLAGNKTRGVSTDIKLDTGFVLVGLRAAVRCAHAG